MIQKALLLCLLLGWQASGLAAETLVIPGTGACEPVLKDLAAAFNAKHPGKEVIIPPTIGTRGGLRELLNKNCLLARIVMPMEPGKIDPRLQYQVFARDAMVFAVGAGVEVQSLTLPQLVDIFSGKITDWVEVGGRPSPIRVIIREPYDSTMKSIQFHLPEFQNIRFKAEAKIVYNDQEAMNLLKKYKNSIGMMSKSYFYKENSVKVIAINNIAPSQANLKNRDYKPYLDYALCLNKNNLPELGKLFSDFLHSGEGRAIIENYGLIPLDGNINHHENKE